MWRQVPLIRFIDLLSKDNFKLKKEKEYLKDLMIKFKNGKYTKKKLDNEFH